MKRVVSLILVLITLLSVFSLSACGRSEKDIEEEMREFCYEYYVEGGWVPESDFENGFSKTYGEKADVEDGSDAEYIIGFMLYSPGGGVSVRKFKNIFDAKKWEDKMESNPRVRYYCVRKGSYVVGGYDSDAVNGLAKRIF